MKIRYNLDQLQKIIRESPKDRVHFLDKETGEILELSLADPDVRMVQMIKEKIAGAPGRYPQIPKRSPHENYKDLEEFIKTVQDTKLKKRLSEAIEGQGAFRSFRDVIEAYPREKKNWNTFRDNKLNQFIRKFLKEIGMPVAELP